MCLVSDGESEGHCHIQSILTPLKYSAINLTTTAPEPKPKGIYHTTFTLQNYYNSNLKVIIRCMCFSMMFQLCAVTLLIVMTVNSVMYLMVNRKENATLRLH